MTDSPRPLAPGSGEAVAPPRPFEDVASILDHLAPRARSDEERAYLRVHAPRYRFLLQTVSALLERRRPELRGTEPLQVLDIGPHFLTELLAAATPARVNTAGVRFAFPGGHPRIGAHLDIDVLLKLYLLEIRYSSDFRLLSQKTSRERIALLVEWEKWARDGSTQPAEVSEETKSWAASEPPLARLSSAQPIDPAA